MRYLTIGEVLEIHNQIMRLAGTSVGVRDLGALESAVAQPRITFSGKDLYPTLVEKAAALGYSLIQNHPFVDGNKRTGHASMEAFLVLNGAEIVAAVDEQFAMILAVAAGEMSREEWTAWLQAHVEDYNQQTRLQPPLL